MGCQWHRRGRMKPYSLTTCGQDALVFVHIINDVIRELEVAPVQDTVVTTPNPAALDFSGWSEP